MNLQSELTVRAIKTFSQEPASGPRRLAGGMIVGEMRVVGPHVVEKLAATEYAVRGPDGRWFTVAFVPGTGYDAPPWLAELIEEAEHAADLAAGADRPSRRLPPDEVPF